MKPRVHGLYYNPTFVTPKEREAVVSWLSTLRPIWEERFSDHNPPPEGESQRWLLRPVYWLGSWQFACLNYYCPPSGIAHRCVKAEPFPEVLAQMVSKIEIMSRKIFMPSEVPEGWKLNVCLINFYGSKIEDGKRIDTARVGEHKDFEPGPVASLSLGERALFQFVASQKAGDPAKVVSEQWLDDGSLQVFGGNRWKKQFFHRVQRVDRKGGFQFPIQVENFETRRVNFTFRYVPDAHVSRYRLLPADARSDVKRYMLQLAAGSKFFASELK